MRKPSDEEGSAVRYVPPRPTIRKLQMAAAGCKACHLWKIGTQTVFGEGQQTSTIMFVGEQPGRSSVKWEPRGERRIHKKPNAMEIAACRPWLEAEINVIKPRAIVCLGSTAAQAVIGPKFKVSTRRATFVASPFAPLVTATVHPSSILRAPSDEARRTETQRFIDDLKKIRKAIEKRST